MTDEQKQKYREAKKQYRMTDEQIYYKKYYAEKKLNNKTIDDNENDFITSQ